MFQGIIYIIIWKFPESWGYPSIIHFHQMFHEIYKFAGFLSHMGYPKLAGSFISWKNKNLNSWIVFLWKILLKIPSINGWWLGVLPWLRNPPVATSRPGHADSFLERSVVGTRRTGIHQQGQPPVPGRRWIPWWLRGWNVHIQICVG